MSAFVSSHAADDDADEAVARTLAGLSPLPEGANLGFVYTTDTFAAELPSLVGRLREATGVKDWVGTVGLGVSAASAGYFDRPALSVMIGALPKDSFRIFSGLEHGMDRFRRDHGDWIAARQPGFGVVHADPRNPKTPEMVARLADELTCYLAASPPRAAATPRSPERVPAPPRAGSPACCSPATSPSPAACPRAAHRSARRAW